MREPFSLSFCRAPCGLALAVACVACGSAPSQGFQAPDPSTAADVVGPSGGRVSTADGASIDIPPGALTTDVVITINPNGKAPMLTAAQALSIPRLFGPDGQQFLKPVKITLGFDPGSLPQGTSAMQVTVYSAPSTSNAYQALPTSLSDSTHVTAQASQLGDMTPGAVATGGTVILDHPL